MKSVNPDGLQARRAAGAAAALDRPVLVAQGNANIASPCVSHLVLSQEIAGGRGGGIRIASIEVGRKCEALLNPSQSKIRGACPRRARDGWALPERGSAVRSTHLLSIR